MILSTPTSLAGAPGSTLPAVVAVVLYVVAATPVPALRRFGAAALVGAWVLHLAVLAMDIGGVGLSPGSAAHGAHMRLGFGPVLSLTVWLVIGVHQLESRFLPMPGVRTPLALAGAIAVGLALLFPGEPYAAASRLAPLHFVLGFGAYGLFAVAVLHAVLLGRAERRLRPHALAAARAPGDAGAAEPVRPEPAPGIPLLQLERLTFRFVEAGFVALTATLLLGMATASQWRLDHKTLLSLLAWGVFAALLVGRHVRGWRGRQATRWLYAGAVLLLLAYAGSRFVFEVLLGRLPT